MASSKNPRPPGAPARRRSGRLAAAAPASVPAPAVPRQPRPDAALHPWLARLFAPIDAASLGVFRSAFGALMVWHGLQYVTGAYELYLVPRFFFKFPGFAWVHASPAVLWTLFWSFVVLGVLIALGIASRVACGLFFLAYSYLFLIDTADYQNHTYLICLLAFLLTVLPVHRAFALGVRRAKRADWIPTWALWLLRFQVAAPYVGGGIAKLNRDWLLRAEPMGLWLSEGTEGPFRAGFIDERWAAYGIAWSGALYDLLIVPALLWRRTRWPAFLITLLFHLWNSRLFDIGVFPWLMIAATLLFFPPDWPRRVRLMRRDPGPPPAATTRRGRHAAAPPSATGPTPRRRVVLAFLAAWVTVQLLLPFRHLLYPGPVDWNEEGHRFAWRMKLRDKRGTLRFVAVDKRTGEVNPLDAAVGVLTERQWVMMVHDPDMIRQFARFVDRGMESTGYGPIEVRAITSISLNRRPPQPLVDPEVDLAAQPRSWGRAKWIVPLRE
jgi:hypothetical protein